MPLLIKLFASLLMFLAVAQSGNVDKQDVAIQAAEVSFDENTDMFVNNADNFTVIYPKSLYPAYDSYSHSTFLDSESSEGYAWYGIIAKDTNLANGYDWVKSENAKRKDQPPITIVKVNKYEVGDVFFLKTPTVIDHAGDKPIYGDGASAIFIKDNKIYIFKARVDWKGNDIDKDFLKIIESFHFNVSSQVISDLTDIENKLNEAHLGITFSEQGSEEDGVAWMTDDNKNIYISEAAGTGSRIPIQREMSAQQKADFQEKVNNITDLISADLLQRGFQKNQKNAYENVNNESFYQQDYDYVLAYEKKPIVCTITLIGFNEVGAEWSEYRRIIFACSDKLNKYYDAEIPFLTALQEVKKSPGGSRDGAIVSGIRKQKGDFVMVNWGAGHSGFSSVLKKIDGKYKEIFAGQEDPHCNVVVDNKIPMEIFDECYNEQGTDELNVYDNKKNQFSILYPRGFKLVNHDENTLGLMADDGTDGPWLISIQVSETNAQTSHDWVKSENSKRKNQPPITIAEVRKYKAGDTLFLKTPVAIDSEGGKPIYANQDSAIIIKNNKLYTFTLLTQLEDPALKKNFLDIIESFHFIDS
jgi:hypothetical protein